MTANTTVSLPVITNSSESGTCGRLPDLPHGAKVTNVSESQDDVRTVTYECNNSYVWEKGSLTRHCHGNTGNWTGSPIVCYYDDPILRAELIGGIVGGVFFILLIVLSIDFVYQKRKKVKTRSHPKRPTEYGDKPRPTSFIISYATTDSNRLHPLNQSPDVVKDTKKTKKGKALKNSTSIGSKQKLEPIGQAVKKKKKKKKVQPVVEEENHVDAVVPDSPVKKVKKKKKKSSTTSYPALDLQQPRDPESDQLLAQFQPDQRAVPDQSQPLQRSLPLPPPRDHIKHGYQLDPGQNRAGLGLSLDQASLQDDVVPVTPRPAPRKLSRPLDVEKGRVYDNDYDNEEEEEQDLGQGVMY